MALKVRSGKADQGRWVVWFWTDISGTDEEELNKPGFVPVDFLRAISCTSKVKFVNQNFVQDYCLEPEILSKPKKSYVRLDAMKKDDDTIWTEPWM